MDSRGDVEEHEDDCEDEEKDDEGQPATNPVKTIEAATQNTNWVLTF